MLALPLAKGLIATVAVRVGVFRTVAEQLCDGCEHPEGRPLHGPGRARLHALQVLRMLELVADETSLSPDVGRIVAARLRATLR